MPDALYKFVRCELGDEDELLEFISFRDEQGFNVPVIDNAQLIISEAMFHYLKKIVIEASENADLFDP